MLTPFEQSARAHAATVLRVCRAVLGVGADADDAWSETFLAALQAWPGLDADTNVEAWLVRVAQRKAIDIIRRRARQTLPEQALEQLPSTIGIPGQSDHGLWAEVAALPQQQRLAIAYHYLGGLAHTETAELIGSSPEAVRRAASDGMRTLRARYRASAHAEGDR